ncbi:MAG: hypothetical protein ACJAY5_001376 [Actinomycetes bacterium]|jgi:hypothetical protein
MFWLSIVVAFISAVVVVLGMLHDDSGPNKGAAGAGISAIGVVGLFAGVYLGSL